MSLQKEIALGKVMPKLTSQSEIRPLSGPGKYKSYTIFPEFPFIFWTELNFKVRPKEIQNFFQKFFTNILRIEIREIHEIRRNL